VKPSRIHDDARAEFDAAIGFYQEQQEGLGLDFHAEIQKAIEIIERHPQIGSPYKATPLRRYVTGHFPYLIFYLELEEVIWIVAIAHTKRRPDYWKQREIESPEE
jgi:toxin ParE1/3/4